MTNEQIELVLNQIVSDLVDADILIWTAVIGALTSGAPLTTGTFAEAFRMAYEMALAHPTPADYPFGAGRLDVGKLRRMLEVFGVGDPNAPKAAWKPIVIPGGKVD